MLKKLLRPSSTIAAAIVLLFFIAIGTPAQSQINLVPNPSFEDTVSCPNGANQIDRALGWMNFGNTPDYFNSCSSNFSVPSNPRGYQFAHSGNAYAGLFSYDWNDYREFIAIHLTNSLIIGQRYFVTFYASHEELPGSPWLLSTNKLGARFTTNSSYSTSNPVFTDNFSQIFTDTIIQDTSGWFKINGSFVADSAYDIIVLGNFFDNAHTDTIASDSNATAAEYYLDDICVSIDSSNCNFKLAIDPVQDSGAKVTYDFQNHMLNISQNSPMKTELFIYDIIGKLIYNEISSSQNYHVDMANLSGGHYLASLFFQDKNLTTHIIVF